MQKVRIGIVGLGRLGMYHAESLAFRVPGAELAAAVSPVEAQRTYVREKLGVPNTYSTLGEMLDDRAKIDAVVLVTPSGLHCAQIAEVMDAGLHVFTEKPLGMNVEQCRVAEAAVAKHPELKFMIGFMRRFDPSYAHAKELVDSGAIGRPIMLRATSMDAVTQINSFLPFAPTSGGIFRDMSVHDVDLARWYLGAELKSVYATGGCYMFPQLRDCGDVDTGLAVLNFTNGTTAELMASRIAPHGSHVETEIFGTREILRISAVPERNLITIFNSDGALRECVTDFRDRWREAYVNELTSFVDCIVNDKTPLTCVADGTESTRIAAAVMEALDTRKIVEM